MAQNALSATMGWRLRRLTVCASTELELDRWLRQLAPEPCLAGCGLAVVAERQRYGRGQRGRHWLSPAGGLWLSAAMDWPLADAAAGAPLTLATAVGLALQLESLGLKPQIKWPNDLLLDGRKLAGILPRLRLAGGRVRWAQVGLGLNGINRVPAGAIAVGSVLRQRQGLPPKGECFHPRAKPQALLPLALAALDWARRHAAQPGVVQQLVEARLYRPAAGWAHQNRLWQVDGIGRDGSLALRCQGERISLRRLEINPTDPA